MQPAAPQNFSDAETPVGPLDGVNAAFTVVHTPIAGSLQVFLNGVHLAAPGDYSLSGTAITFAPTAVPQPGAVIVAFYRY